MRHVQSVVAISAMLYVGFASGAYASVGSGGGDGASTSNNLVGTQTSAGASTATVTLISGGGGSALTGAFGGGGLGGGGLGSSLGGLDLGRGHVLGRILGAANERDRGGECRGDQRHSGARRTNKQG